MDGPSLFTGADSDDGTFVPFTDILFNVLLGFTMMVFVAFALIRPDAKSGIIDTNAEFIITTTWPDDNDDDIDTYVQDPTGNVVWYHSMQKGFVTLDRDVVHPRHTHVEAGREVAVEPCLGDGARCAVEVRLGAVVADAATAASVHRDREPQLLGPSL